MTEQDPGIIKQKLNHDTAKIEWSALQEPLRQELVIKVSTDLDLIEVGCQFSLDNHDQVKAWMDSAQVQKVDDAQAQAWSEDNRELWAVVVAPWVLVQEPKPGSA